MIVEEFFRDLMWYHKGLLIYMLITLRYLVIAGFAFVVFYVWKKNPWRDRKIQTRPSKSSQYRKEIYYSLSTFVIFTATALMIIYLTRKGYTQIYDSVAEYGWGYFLISIIIMVFLHDTYFYWTHRWMHHPRIFRHVHLVHHLSNNPSPWAAFSFHPIEAVIEAAILPLIVFLLPVHPVAIFLFLLFMILFNVLGHLGYEIFPRQFIQSLWGKFFNSSTHHNMHHKYFKYNFGLYFNLWDRWRQTNHPQYESHFRDITQKKDHLPAQS